MEVRDIMTKKVLTVSFDSPIDQVANILITNRIHGVPVVDGKKLVGIITENDFFSTESEEFDLLSYMEFIRKKKPASSMSEKEKERMQKIITSSAKDIMTKDCISVLPQDDVKRLIEVFRKTKFSSVPVVDEKSHLQGIITRSDVINTIRL